MQNKNFVQQRISILLRIVWVQSFLLVCILHVARYCMHQAFVDRVILRTHTADITRMYLVGLRYDLKVVFILLLPFLLTGLIMTIHHKSWQLLRLIGTAWCGLIAFITTIVSICNFFYYQTFHNYIDVFAYGLFEDQTGAVLRNVWQDYPVVQSVLGALFFAFVSVYLNNIIFKNSIKNVHRWRTAIFISYVFISFVVIGCLIRGSFGTFPLAKREANISTIAVLNKFAPNGLMAIDWARKDQKANSKFFPVSSEDGKRLMQMVGLSSLEARTPINTFLAKNKPNVIFILMESMGSNQGCLIKINSNFMLS